MPRNADRATRPRRGYEKLTAPVALRVPFYPARAPSHLLELPPRSSDEERSFPWIERGIHHRDPFLEAILYEKSTPCRHIYMTAKQWAVPAPHTRASTAIRQPQQYSPTLCPETSLARGRHPRANTETKGGSATNHHHVHLPTA